MASDDRPVTQGGAGLDLALVETDDALELDPVRGFVPKTVGDLKRLAILMSKTEFVPSCFRNKPSDVFLALNYAIAAGMDNLILGIQDMYVIHGRVSMYGNSCRALLMRSGLLEDLKEEWSGEFPDDDFSIRITMKRKGIKSPFIGEWSVADEKQAGIFGSNVHKTYPKDMMYWRAWHRAAGRGFSDVMKGIVPREIARDMEDLEQIEVLPNDLDAATDALKKRKRRGKGKKKQELEVPAVDPTAGSGEPQSTSPENGTTTPPNGEPTTEAPNGSPDSEPESMTAEGDDPEMGEEPEGTEPNEEPTEVKEPAAQEGQAEEASPQENLF